LFGDCPEAHAGEQNCEDDDDSRRDDTSCGGVVLILSIVAKKFGVRE